MAQRDATSTGKELTSKKQRPSSSKFQSSLSQPAPNRDLTLPVLSNNNYPPSPAELYILSRSQMSCAPNERQRISPETPSSTTFSSPLSPMGHAERMNIWRQKQSNEICRKHKTRYMYGSPPPRSSSNFTLSSPTYFTSVQPSVAPIQTVKANNLRDRATTKESRDISKISSDV